MSTGVPPEPPEPSVTPEDLAQMLAATAIPTPGPGSGGAAPGSLRKKLLVAVVVAAVGLGASIMSCVGQSFSYRQARAMEGIEQQLKEIRASCPATETTR